MIRHERRHPTAARVFMAFLTLWVGSSAFLSVTYDNNIAFASGGDVFHDALSMPEEPTLSPDSFESSQLCAACHPAHYEQWRQSMHAQAMIDPVYRAAVKLRQDAFDGAQDQFCLQCHSPIGTRGGEIVDGFRFEDLSQTTLEGVNCVTCHRSVRIERPFNSGHVLDANGPMRGPISDPVANLAHESQHSAHFESSTFCAACHDVTELNGLVLERPYGELKGSPLAGQSNCQTCHMPEYEGVAALGGPRRTLHHHTFRGAGVPLEPGFLDETSMATIRARAKALLESSAEVVAVQMNSPIPGRSMNLSVTVRNKNLAHNLPTGSTFNSQMWLEVIVTDARGRVLYQSGQTDENGDLMNHSSALAPDGDPDLVMFSSVLFDASGEQQVLTWLATEHVNNTIPPGESRTLRFRVPVPSDAVGPLRAQAQVNYRSYAPSLLRTLGLERLLDNLEVFPIASAEAVAEF